MRPNTTEEFMQILVVIDTEYIKACRPKQTRPIWRRPVPIEHQGQHMFAYCPRGINSGQGTADLELNAWLGDGIDFASTSIYQDSDDAVILYGIEKHEGDDVFSPFSPVTIQRAKSVVPDSKSPDRNGLPPILAPQNFNKLLARVIGTGKAEFLLQFGLYTLDNDSQTQSLYGYFSWDPTINISNVA